MQITRRETSSAIAVLMGGAFRDHWAWFFYIKEDGRFLIMCAKNRTMESEINCIKSNSVYLGRNIPIWGSYDIIEDISLPELKHIVNKHFKYTMWL
jgi:hypothetical protein